MNNTETIRTFLSNPYLYGVTTPVILHETHGAIVGVGGNIAIKVKKPICFPYMDYSTTEKRTALCQREVMLNQRTAPTLYNGTKPIYQDNNGNLSFDNIGNVVDCAIIMNRFDENRLLSNQDNISSETCQKVATKIATFHKNEPAITTIDGYEMMVGVVKGNDFCFNNYADTINRQKTTDLTHTTLNHLEKYKGLLNARASSHIKQCHGDLYLKNIYLDDEYNPVPFDCIEFNDAFAQIDTGYDIAFLLMDLSYRGMNQQVWDVRQFYINETGDFDCLLLMPAFMSIRSSIRSHVSVAIASGINDKLTADGFILDAHKYLDFALSLLQPKIGKITAFGGYSGSGKTTIATQVARNNNAILLSSDVIRKIQHGAPITEKLSATAYTTEKSAIVYNYMQKMAIDLARGGQDVVLDATFLSGTGRNEIQNMARKNNIPFTGFWVELDDHIANTAISNRTNDASDATIAIRKQQQSSNVGEITWQRINGHVPLEKQGIKL